MTMERSKAEAIAQAVLEPDLKVQEELGRKRVAEERSLAERRKVAWFVLAGLAVGAGVAYFGGHRISAGALWGGIVAALVGWGLVGWRRYRLRRVP